MSAIRGDTAILTYKLLNQLFAVINEYEDKDFYSNVMMLYEKYNAKLSFADCSILVNMQMNNMENVLSFDNEFERFEHINLIS